eukprot:TRINITY_DN2953_c0_g2_i1.p1 TRINITY_DN2953_c0_g2~~TRINITY_DN2953_c0_g2_i1.p1  ORF type:complete len:185 (-),score=32.68 TRINITY_DN2953_c0_g2_i1:122-640(-)
MPSSVCLGSIAKILLLALVLVDITLCARNNKKGLQGLGGLGGLDFGKGFTMKVHGHYCGPGHGDPTYKMEALDAIDEVCKAHDQCYDTKFNGFYNDCYCDHVFIRDLKKALKSSPSSSHGMINLMSSWFEGSSCSCLNDEGKRTLLDTITPGIKGKCKQHGGKKDEKKKVAA